MANRFVGGPAHGHRVPWDRVTEPLISVDVSEYTDNPKLRKNADESYDLYQRAKPYPGDPTKYRVKVEAFYRQVYFDGEGRFFVFQGMNDADALQCVKEGFDVLYG